MSFIYISNRNLLLFVLNSFFCGLFSSGVNSSSRFGGDDVTQAVGFPRKHERHRLVLLAVRFLREEQEKVGTRSAHERRQIYGQTCFYLASLLQASTHTHTSHTNTHTHTPTPTHQYTHTHTPIHTPIHTHTTLSLSHTHTQPGVVGHFRKNPRFFFYFEIS